MKTLQLLFLSVLCILNFSLVKAQPDQGKIMVGVSSSLELASTGANLMSLGYTTTSTKSDASGAFDNETYKTTNLNLLPKVGYFMINNLAVGIDLGVNTSNTKYTTYTSNSTFFSVGPFIRYYLATGNLLPFIELEGSLGKVSNKSTYENSGSTSESNSDIFNLGGNLGLTIPLGGVAAFDVMLGYNSLTAKESENNPNNVRTVLSAFGLKLGFVVFL
jgi:hypothetical protein